MQINTKYFGSVNYGEEDVISFPNGLFGFERETTFLLLPFEGSGGSLLCFQSVQTPSLAFVAMDPFALYPAYAPVLTSEELRFLGARVSQDLCYYVLCVVRDPVSESTVNLRCPIVIHPGHRTAIQVILEDTEYHMRHRLGDFSAEVVCNPC